MVESKELIMDVAKNVKEIGAHFLRGGAFKPLTFPYRSNKYNETREEGISWLGLAKEKFNIPVITEVMEEKYLDMICEVADILQIGSRNMQNYPLITAAAKTKKPLMIKRHYGSSLRDWLGAAEYALIEGNEKVILCERGVSAPPIRIDYFTFFIRPTSCSSGSRGHTPTNYSRPIACHFLEVLGKTDVFIFDG